MNLERLLVSVALGLAVSLSLFIIGAAVVLWAHVLREYAFAAWSFLVVVALLSYSFWRNW